MTRFGLRKLLAAALVLLAMPGMLHAQMSEEDTREAVEKFETMRRAEAFLSRLEALHAAGDCDAFKRLRTAPGVGPMLRGRAPSDYVEQFADRIRRLDDTPCVPPTPANACDRPAPNPLAADCIRFRLLLGRWSAGKSGGMIATTLNTDGTITATVLSASKLMRDNGYVPGMPVLRGYRPAAATNTWVVMARGGELYIAQKPARRGEPSPKPAEWIRAGTLFIARFNERQLGLPGQLDNLIASEGWMRVGDLPPAR